MHFEYPIVLWGLLAGLVPVWIHMFGKRPKKTVDIPSLIWLKSITPSKHRNRKIKDFMVLVLRVLTILIVVVVLAKPNWPSTIKTIQIDNYPAKWSERFSWMPPLISTLEPGLYRVFSRDGTYLGTIDQSAIEGFIPLLEATVNEVVSVDGAILISYGFAPIPMAFQDYLLPLRRNQFNTSIKREKSSHLSNTYQLIGGIDSVEWQLQWDQDVVDRQRELEYQLDFRDIRGVDSTMLTILGDSIIEDNTAKFYASEKSKMVIWSVNPTVPQELSSMLDKGDTLVYYNSNNIFNPFEFQTVVLYGFDFIPQIMSDFSGQILRFPSQSVSVELSMTQPDMTDGFFADFFLGASIQNQWPMYSESSSIDSGSCILSGSIGCLASISKHNNQQIYQQGFVTLDWSHPYFTALWQWAGLQNQFKEILPWPLGKDSYDMNIKDLEVLGARYELVSIDGRPAKIISFWTIEKIGLALALFCALLALIFAKINS
jgi:hypothetical protein